MRKIILLLFSVLGCALSKAQPSQPNIIFVLVDDLGYGDLGEFFQDDKSGNSFDTPFLDQMTNEGMRINNHYTVPVCAPSRSSLLQGLNPGQAEIRDNRFDNPIPLDMNIAQLMKDAGYKTFMIGKHGVAGGAKVNHPSHPINHGFDDYFGYLNHVAGHEHYPRNGTTEKEAFLYEGKTKITTGTDKVYTTDVFTARAKKNIIDHVDESPKQPFFMYIAYDVPHSKLQIPQVAYPAGKGVNGGIQWTGPDNTTTPYVNTATGTIDSYHYPDVASQNWTDDAKKHVSMIRRLGECMNDIMVTLQDLNIDENTLVVFTSDNGPHNTGGQDPNYFESYGPFRGGKRDVTDGGVRVPVIAWWPGTISANSSTDQNCGMWNWAATFSDIANQPIPARVDGTSLLPILNGSETEVENLPPYVEYYHSRTTRQQMQFIRMGDYVGIRTEVSKQSDPLEIYNIVTDPKQENNLVNDFPQLQEAMRNQTLRMRRAHDKTPRPYDDALIPGVPVNTSGSGLDYQTVTGDFNYIPRVDEMQITGSGQVANIDLSVRPAANNFAIQYNGFINIPADGEYTFYMQSDAPGHLMIHDIHVVGSDVAHTTDEVSRSLYLQAGYHPVKVYYQHNDQSTYNLALSYEGPSISKQAIPNSAFLRGTQLPEVTTESFVNILHKTSNAILVGNESGSSISGTHIISEEADSAKWSIVNLNNGYFHLVQKSSGRKLHSGGDFSSVSTTSPQWDGDNTQWRWIEVADDDWFRLEHKTSGKWLHMGSSGNASSFRLADPSNSTGNNTRWRPEEKTYLSITHKTSSTILSALSNGNSVATSSTSSDVTNWHIIPTDNEYFHIVHRTSGKKLHSSGDFSIINTTSAQWSGDNTQWKWVKIIGDDWYRLQHKGSGKWLHINGPGDLSSFKLLGTGNTGDNTRWRPEVAPEESSNPTARLLLEDIPENSTEAFDFTLFPNPTQGNVTIDISGIEANSTAIIKVVDLSGRTIYTKSFSLLNGPTSLNLDVLNSGLYAVKVATTNNKPLSKLLTIK